MYANGAGIGEEDENDWKDKQTGVQGRNSFKDPQIRLNTDEGIEGRRGVSMDSRSRERGAYLSDCMSLSQGSHYTSS